MENNFDVVEDIESRLHKLEQSYSGSDFKPVKLSKQILGITRGSVYRLRDNGLIRLYRLGGTAYFKMSEVESALQKAAY